MPDWRAEIQRRLASQAYDPDVVEELAQHLEQQYAELRVTVGEARAAELIDAQLNDDRLLDTIVRHRRRRGPLPPIGEPRRGSWFAGAIQDLRFGARSLVRAPVFTTVAILSLAVGIGATTAIFGLLNTVLFARLAVRNPEQLVQLQRSSGRGLVDRLSYAAYVALARSPSIPRLEATAGNNISALANGVRSFPHVDLVSGGFFDMLGVRPLLGRAIDVSDERGHAAVVVVSQDYWERELAADRDAVGKHIQLESAAFTIIGVLPRSYNGLIFGTSFEMAVPMSVAPLVGMPPFDDARRSAAVSIYARMAPGQTPVQAGRLIDAAYQACCAALAPSGTIGSKRVPGAASGTRSQLGAVDASRGISNPKTHLREEYRQILLALMAGVSVLLLIACANVGNLLLARASARERELAVRISMGATRGRIVRQLLTESVELATIGALFGAVIARLATNALSHNLPPVARSLASSIPLRPSAAILGFTAAVTVVATLVFGVWPAVRSTRGDLASPLKDGARGASRRTIADRAVVSGQVALALVLVCGAALFVATLRNLRSTDSLDPSSRLLLAGVDARATVYQAHIAPLVPDIVARTRALPGVTNVAMSSTIPVFGGNSASDVIRVSGFEPSDNADSTAWFASVSPDYFATIGLAIERGRAFTTDDSPTSERVAIVSQAFAAHFFAGRDPLGQTITLGAGAGAMVMRIVGIARDAHYDDLRSSPSEIYYAPLTQSPDMGRLQLAVRTTLDPSSLAPSVRRAIDAAAPGLRLGRLEGLEQAFDEALARERLAAALATLFGIVALGLAAVGLYGVVAYNVSRRTREIGVRMALGARPVDALWLVVRQTLAMTLAGVIAGVPLAYLATMAVRAQLYGLDAHDPLPLVAAAVLLVAVGLLSSVVPARRASHVDPVVALRSE